MLTPAEIQHKVNTGALVCVPALFDELVQAWGFETYPFTTFLFPEGGKIVAVPLEAYKLINTMWGCGPRWDQP